VVCVGASEIMRNAMPGALELTKGGIRPCTARKPWLLAGNWQLMTKGQRYWPQGATWKAGVQACSVQRAGGKVGAGASAPPKVPDVTLQPEQGGAHHRDNRPSPRPRWESLEVAATGPFEGGEVWLGHLWGGRGGELPELWRGHQP
jgi:hypothetical protein